ncbi:NERD domain-containing protein [Photobacterium satsumensis]|uniref:nuclease-related domain-containing protein n=1 Tax=Photobacterium satsumensis TaxID=2910239 RepID=UPI003D09C3CA
MMHLLRGWFGEKKTTLNMWMSLDNSDYHRFHNLFVPTFNGTAQIDHLIISQYGIFIVETKNLKGWIFGNESSKQWTQSLYGKKYRFQNPLHQTYRQKKALSNYFNIDESLIQTVIYFSGDCSLKTVMPINIMDRGLGRYIKSFRRELLSTTQKKQLIGLLHSHVSTCTVTNREHVKSLRERHSSSTSCPRCGSSLVERVARNGPNAGRTFLGCQSFPKCRFIKNN